MIEIASDDLRENDPMRAAYHAKLTRGLLLTRVLSFSGGSAWHCAARRLLSFGAKWKTQRQSISGMPVNIYGKRLHIPGFLRARRCVRELGSPSYFMIYELSNTSVLTSPDYLARLNNPTPWTKQIMAMARSANRTLCRVVGSHGIGIGAYLLTARVEALNGPGSELSAWTARSLATVAEQQGITGAHLLHRDTVGFDTKERQLRQRTDGSSDVVVLIEGYDPNAVAAIAKELPATVKPVAQIDLYQVAQIGTAEDTK